MPAANELIISLERQTHKQGTVHVEGAVVEAGMGFGERQGEASITLSEGRQTLPGAGGA